MEVVNKIDYRNAILKNTSLELQFDQIELDDKEIIVRIVKIYKVLAK